MTRDEIIQQQCIRCPWFDGEVELCAFNYDNGEDLIEMQDNDPDSVEPVENCCVYATGPVGRKL